MDMRLLLADIYAWKSQYIRKQLKKSPDITKGELIRKMKKAKVQKFSKQSDNLLQVLGKD